MLISELVNWYKDRPHFLRCSENTKRTYTLHLNQALALIEDKEVFSFTAEDADDLYLDMQTKHGLTSALGCMRIMRRVWFLGMRYGHCQSNPFQKMGLDAQPIRKVIWTLDQIHTFLQTSHEVERPSVGILAALCYVFCQRPVDIRQLKWKDYHGEFITMNIKKGKKTVIMFVPPFVRDMLDSIPRTSEYIIVREDTNEPFTERDYNKIVHEIKLRANLPIGLQIRDLRKTGLTEAGGMELTDAELQSLSTHSNRETLNIYQLQTLTVSYNAMRKRFNLA